MHISVINSKGGIGKTTTAINLAAGLRRKGKTVLLVDLDPQGSASLSLGIERLHPGSDAVIFGESSADSVIQNDVIPGNAELSNVDFSLAGHPDPHKIIRDNFTGLDYDFVIFDCPPSTSFLTIGAIYASQGYLIPVQPHFLALEGLKSFLSTIDKAKRSFGVRAQNLGLIITLADYRAKATRQVIGLLRDHFGNLVFETEVRINTKLSEAPSYGQDIFTYAPGSTGAAAYEKLTNELLTRV